MAARTHDLTDEQWLVMAAEWGGCAYCGAADRPLQRDCVQPISRGGRYTFENVVPACASCNASKGNGEVTSWMRRKRLDERSFLLRQREVVVVLRARYPTADAPADGDPADDVRPADARPDGNRPDDTT